MKHEELKWMTKDNLPIYSQCWLTEDTPKAIMCLVHGMGEHSGRYRDLAQFLVSQGYSVIAYDQRGHGKSGGKRGHTPSYDHLLDGIDQLLNEAEKVAPGAPKYLFGHSMGGNLVINYGLRRDADVLGIISSSPWLKLAFEPPKMEVKLGKIMRNIYPAYSQSTDLDTQALSRDKQVVMDYENDPLVHDKITAGMFLSLHEAGQYALNHAKEFARPLLIYHGNEDELTSFDASEQFGREALEENKDVTFKPWMGFYHECHNEPEKEEVYNYVKTWMDTHLPGSEV